MSATQDQTLKSNLEALECHFTWDLSPCRSKLLRLKDQLLDIGTEEGNVWLGHIYNLRGFIQYKLGHTEDARSLFTEAAEAFRKVREAEEGPWLLVNYGNLAWLHHHLGDQEQSQACLSRVNDLKNRYPPPDQEQLHAEVCAEKAWTLMKFSKDKKLLAKGYFETALEMQSEMVEWKSSHVIGLVSASKHNSDGLGSDIWEKLRVAKEKDPENLYLAARDLRERVRNDEQTIDKDELRELGRKIVGNPVSSYSGLKPVLGAYRNSLPIDEAIELAEEALGKHPDVRYLKRCVALCYKWKILFIRDSIPDQTTIQKAISLHEEVISLYPDSSLVKEIDLANISAKKNGGMAKAEQIYQELLERDLDPATKQMLYYNYAKYLNFDRKDYSKSTQYHMKTAKIPEQSFFRDGSIRVLEKIKARGRDRKCKEIGEFLKKLPKL